MAASYQSLKYALSYRLAACTVDFLGIVLVGSYSVALIQADQFGPPDYKPAEQASLDDTIVDFVILDQ
eukprot:CAMPEP_0185583470 /NCGR_PEP_ID=MMETSP0434-20130131/23381_1 /TAXON_ID=626734 ORGANISM="Favella taraikaensis, Strain Fe Narragansett Bay" /NCGR_SAMPLE_ID=MMETSP0434 /ASSEMBLY_ACC=CAM_ASM_000379 /LENGTH=67 /DNA_ID=CAMNT_0028202593 /DNA_START=380 /DNA_END=583 /DNA_ORIENTATION=+